MTFSRTKRLGLLLALAAIAGVPAGASEALVRETEAWRAGRVAQLTAPDNWLSLVGLHFLKPGVSTIGGAAGNDVVLGRGPDRLGTIEVRADGTVWLTVEAAADVKVDGRKVRRAELKIGEGAVPSTPVTFGTTTLFALNPNGRKALRVKDSASPYRTGFAGLDYFPVDPAWRIEARWEAFERSRIIQVTDGIGQTGPALIPGRAVFERDGRQYELLAIDEGRDRPLFFVMSDATSGRETYGASRFLYVPWPSGDRIVLDFNRAENPPCAFTPFSMCPLPPKENRLPFAVTAGEKTYRGKHE